MREREAGDPYEIGPYRVLGRLGAGGMGRVYLGRGPDGLSVAVKVVHESFAADPAFRRRFRREVTVAGRLGADWTVPVLGADPDAEPPWVASVFVPGPALDVAVRRHGPLPVRAVRALGEGLGGALTVMAGLDMVHRDVKPGNVLLTDAGPRLIDFGIAWAADLTEGLTHPGLVLGSPGYMAPEQVRGQRVTGAADVFALGAVLGWAAGGRPVFPGEHQATVLYAIVHEEPDLSGVPEEGGLRELVAACLTKDPAARPGPAEVVAACAGALGPSWLPGVVRADAHRAALDLIAWEAADDAGRVGPARAAGRCG
ncbi:serine/threonine-protein kinase [Streptomyces sp. BI20]|uniref:serine/threonine-protein kinase n=1 Tax=Streptomyces sp. BI20 TaxID=3403460 RepID=UPI003C79144B